MCTLNGIQGYRLCHIKISSLNVTDTLCKYPH